MERLPSGIKLRQLQYFLAIADTLHFSKAADLVFATQPTLSHQIAQLEQHLGVVLFDRVGKSIRLTEAGSLLKDYAARAMKELEAGCVALGELHGLQRGNLRIGVVQSFSRTLLAPILGAFMQNYPAIRVHIEEMTADAIESGLANGTLDLGIGFAPTVSEHTESEAVLEERLLLVVGIHHPWAKRKSVRMIELDGEPIALLASNFSTRRLINQYLADAGSRPNVVCETNSIEVMLGAVSKSPLTTIIPEQALDLSKYPELRALALTQPVPVRNSVLLWPRSGSQTVAARTFAGLMKERIASKTAA